jgi:isoquinoline 1-oxidoreductase subunit alpha
MITLRVNGQEQSFDGDPTTPLLWFLRDEIGLTGTKFGCGVALCGACTVHLNGQAARSCVVTLADASGKNVVTIEGLDQQGNHPVQRAWRAVNVPQCGYCQTGQIMQAAALLSQTPNPSTEQIHTAMAGNICRCGCYQRIEAAVRVAATGA